MWLTLLLIALFIVFLAFYIFGRWERAQKFSFKIPKKNAPAIQPSLDVEVETSVNIDETDGLDEVEETTTPAKIDDEQEAVDVHEDLQPSSNQSNQSSQPDRADPDVLTLTPPTTDPKKSLRKSEQLKPNRVTESYRPPRAWHGRKAESLIKDDFIVFYLWPQNRHIQGTALIEALGSTALNYDNDSQCFVRKEGSVEWYRLCNAVAPALFTYESLTSVQFPGLMLCMQVQSTFDIIKAFEEMRQVTEQISQNLTLDIFNNDRAPLEKSDFDRLRSVLKQKYG